MGALRLAGKNGEFELTGSLDFKTVPSIWRQGLTLFENHQDIRLDLQNVERTDSAGLVLLIEWMRFASDKKKSITYVNVPKQMLAIARVSSLDNILPLMRV